MDTKRFSIRTLLTVTTGRLLTKPRGDRDNGIGDLYDLLDWMTADSNYTHQLPRVARECGPWLLRWFPELESVDAIDMRSLDKALERDGAKGIEDWLIQVARLRGLKAEYDVPRMPADDHERKNPYDELVAMRGTDEGVVVLEIEAT